MFCKGLSQINWLKIYKKNITTYFQRLQCLLDLRLELKLLALACWKSNRTLYFNYKIVIFNKKSQNRSKFYYLYRFCQDDSCLNVKDDHGSRLPLKLLSTVVYYLHSSNVRHKMFHFILKIVTRWKRNFIFFCNMKSK